MTNMKTSLKAHYKYFKKLRANQSSKAIDKENATITIDKIKSSNVYKDIINHQNSTLNRIKFAIKYMRGIYKEELKELITNKTKEFEKGLVSSNDYELWVNSYDSKDIDYLFNLIETQSEFKVLPLISVVMPTYNTNLEFLKLAIESVQAQIYPNWELCICDDASTKYDIKKTVESYSINDKRIKFIQNSSNQGIAETTNEAIKISTGDWVGFLDHDDELTQDALHWVVHHINQSTNCKLIYSDEDKLNEQGQRYEPHFKSDFNYELFLAQNMVCHFTCVKRDIIASVGGLKSEYDGSQDYDLVLRIIEVIDQNQIIHIPRILYHWRACQGSTAITTDNKNYALDAARKAISDHLTRINVGGNVGPAIIPFYNRVKFDLPINQPLTSIIIPTKNKPELIKVCIESILKLTKYKNFEIIIVDNGSDDDNVKEFYKKIPKDNIKIIKADIPFNFSKLVNLGVASSQGEIVVLLNNDIEVLEDDWLDELVSHAIRDKVGAVGAKLLYPDGRAQHNGVIIGLGNLPDRDHGVAGHSHKYFSDALPGYFSRAQLHQALSAVTGACLAIKRSTWDSVHGFNEDLVVAFNDVDFCLRVKKLGFRNVWTPYTKLIHHESASRGFEDNPEKQARFNQEVKCMLTRWDKELVKDQFYNPNLTLKHEDFSLSWPPQV